MDITRRTATAAIAEQLGLTEAEMERRIPSGASTTIGNRAGWAMTYLTKARLIEKVAKFTYRATNKGSDFLQAHDGPISSTDLMGIEGFKEAWEEASKQKAAQRSDPEEVHRETNISSSTTPDEMIDRAVEELAESLQAQLLDQLTEIDPFQFEHVVIDLLFAMGYGGSREEAARVTKKANDEGIDGIISEDRLGLDAVYVQAKRWQNTVGRKEIQSFVGALAGKQANKGVFITTSDYSRNAKDYADTVTQKVILIDGKRLTELMTEYNIGVSTTRTVSIKRLDSDYFEED